MKKKTSSIILALFLLQFLALIVLSPPIHAKVTVLPYVQPFNQSWYNDFQSVVTSEPAGWKECHIAWVREIGPKPGPQSKNLTSTALEIFYGASYPYDPPGGGGIIYYFNEERITNDSIKDYNPMIDMDTSGVIHIVWTREIVLGGADPNSGVSDIMYTNSTNWKIHINVSRQEAGKKNWYPTLIVENDTGKPHIAWQVGYQSPAGEIYYRNETYGSLVKVTNTPFNSWTPSIDLDQNKKVHVVWAEQSGSDMDIRYTNSTIWPATTNNKYLNVSEQVDNHANDLRPDISVGIDGIHISYYRQQANPLIYWAVSNPTNTYFLDLGDVSPRGENSINPSIKVAKNNNPVITYELLNDPDDWAAYIMDYNGTGGENWESCDLYSGNNPATFNWSSIGALDIDLKWNIAYTTFYANKGNSSVPDWDVYVYFLSISGEGIDEIPGFELFYAILNLFGVVVILKFPNFSHRKDKNF
jgi:hypothetical protein